MNTPLRVAAAAVMGIGFIFAVPTVVVNAAPAPCSHEALVGAPGLMTQACRDCIWANRGTGSICQGLPVGSAPPGVNAGQQPACDGGRALGGTGC
jgi:hypothetical protein